MCRREVASNVREMWAFVANGAALLDVMQELTDKVFVLMID